MNVDLQIALTRRFLVILSQFKRTAQGGGGTLQLKIRGGGWLDSLGSEILVGKDILGFFKNSDLDNS